MKMEDVVVVTKSFTYVSISGINSFPTSKSLSLQIDKILKKHIVLKNLKKKHTHCIAKYNHPTSKSLGLQMDYILKKHIVLPNMIRHMIKHIVLPNMIRY